ncbi:hypothetical protein ACUIJN_07730 [Metabacillus halosaccharovorans]|uniref:hypothetical protein n=1 Tax=Metabacillus halosaccharovorans TaxID=930124 RepID=UPI002040A4AB|nr:hypothetical protein [Metabacillus halosaccharovorans]MCM3441954.1 hypothetical protein [Metabacillus halosaccharovorans]
MEAFLLLLAGFVLLVPIMYIVPFGIHIKGKMVLAALALLCAALFTISIHVIPAWQAAAAIFVILVLIGYLLSKKQVLFEQEKLHEVDDIGIEVKDERNNGLVENTLTITIESFVKTDDIENEKSDMSAVKGKMEEISDSVEQFDENNWLNEELTNEHKAEITSLAEVATTIDDETVLKVDKQGVSDDFLFELFEGRESQEIIEDNKAENVNEPNLGVTNDLNELFENLMNDKDTRNILGTSDPLIVEFESLNREKVFYEENVEREVKVEIYEGNLPKEEGNPDEDIFHIEINTEVQKSNKNDLPNNVLDMLLNQFQIYKQVLPPADYEQILQKAIQEAKSEKDCFLFAKELLFYYVQTDNKDKYDLLIRDMNEKLRNYPILIQQLLWIQ